MIKTKRSFGQILVALSIFLATSFFSFTGYPQEVTPAANQADRTQAERSYMIGERYLSKGIFSLRKGEEILNEACKENNITIMKLREMFDKERVELTHFLSSLEKEYDDPRFQKAKDLIKRDAADNLSAAIESFEEAITSDPGFVDAYLKKTLACLEMGHSIEAIKTFKKAMGIGLEKVMSIDPLGDEFRDILYGVASELLQMPHEEVKITPEEIIGLLMELRATLIKESQMRSKTEEERIDLQNRQILNNFEMVRFYRENQKKREAKAEFDKQNDLVRIEIEANPEIYREAEREIKRLTGEIFDLRGEASLTFDIDPSILRDLHYIDISAGLRFIRDPAATATTDAISIYLLPIGYEVEFKNEIIATDVAHGTFNLPMGDYTCMIEIPKMQILDENRFPFVISFEREGKHLRNLSPDLNLKITDEIGGKHNLLLFQDKYICSDEGYLIDERGEHQRLHKGSFKADITERRIELLEGSEYALKIKKSYDWKPPVLAKHTQRTISKIGLGALPLLFILLR